MIRRWSHITILDLKYKFNLKLHLKFFFLNFKKSILFKKYYLKKTKFKRRSLFKLRKKGNWYIYLQILKHWVMSFKFYKNYYKFQYFHKISYLCFLSFDAILFKIKRTPNFLNSSCVVTNFFIKKIFSYFYKIKFVKCVYGFYNFYSYILTKERLKYFFNNTNGLVPLALNYNQNTFLAVNDIKFEKHLLLDFNFNNFNNFNNYLIYKQLTEYYKILILLWINMQIL